jgi:predicted 3-demethylubiquinone-9 3-methyltransferase (glyoxalase superfamily)
LFEGFTAPVLTIKQLNNRTIKLNTMQKISPFLWFNDNAEEAVNFYTSLFPNSKIKVITHYPEGTPGPTGKVMTIGFEMFGQEFTAMNGGPAFKFNEAISMVVGCDTQEELDKYWDALLEGGTAQACGWLKDKYGLSWQITPTKWEEYLKGNAQRVMQAMMKMVKLDIATLENAAKAE